MSQPSPRVQDLQRALRRVHRGVLATLAVCALVIATQGERGSGAGPEGGSPLAALVLGLGSVLARRQAAAPRTPPRLRIPLAMSALLLAGGIGLLGVGIAWLRHEVTVPLLYTLAGALLALRGAPGALPPGPAEEPGP